MNCYVKPQFTEKYDLPKGIDKENTLFYPEAGMSMQQMHRTTTPKHFNIFTDCPYLVNLYKQEEVFIWDEKSNKWINPDMNTYGASYNLIIMRIFKITNTIPAFVNDGQVTNCMGSPLKYE